MANAVLFHRAHYNILAAQIKRQYAETMRRSSSTKEDMIARRTLETLALDLTKRLKLDNETFDPIRFLDACSPNPNLYLLSELWEDDPS